MKQLLTVFALAATIATAQAQVHPAEEMIIDASEMSETNYPAGTLDKVTKILHLTGTWDATQVLCLKKALKAEAKTVNSTLTSVDFAPEAVVNDMDELFFNCKGLQAVVMPTKENTAPVSFRKTFAQNWKMPGTVDLSAFPNISKMDSAFMGCSKLEKIIMPVKRNENPVSFVRAFYQYSFDSEIDLSGFVNITDMTAAFSGASKIIFIKLPTEVNNNEVSFFEAFRSCSELVTLDLSAFSKITDMTGIFQDCAKLVSATLPTTENALAISLQNAFTGCSAWNVPIDLSFLTNITDLMGAFKADVLLSEVKFSTVKNENPMSLLAAFNKTNIATVDLSSFAQITNLTNTFSDCAQLTDVKFAEGEQAAVTNISGMYQSCASLIKADISQFPNVTNLMNTFLNCTALEEIVLPTKEIEASVMAPATFKGCSSLISPIDLSYLKNISMLSSTFDGCEKLTGVKLSSNKHDASTIKGAFTGCAALSSSVDLSGFNGIKDMTDVFNGCTMLPDVIMPEDASEAQIYFVRTFTGCTNLAVPVDMSAYTNIVDLTETFDGCASLPAVILGKYGYPEAENTFRDVNPNCLKYLVAEMKVLPEWMDAEYTNFISVDQAMGDMTLEDGKPFFCPKEFSLGQYKMSYIRDFTDNFANEVQGWNTICLPFNATLSLNAGVTPYAGTEDKYWLRELTAAMVDSLEFTDATAIKANTPYIIALPGNGMKDKESLEGKTMLFTADSKVIPATPEALAGEAVENFAFTGTFSPIAEQPMYLLTRGNEKEVDAFVYGEKASVAPFRAYVTALNGDAQKVTTLKLDRIVPLPVGIERVENDGTATAVYMVDGILTIDAKQTATIGVYTIDGRLVRTVDLQEGTNRISGLSVGAYIIAGHKIVIGY